MTPLALQRRFVERSGIDIAVYEGGDPDSATVVLVHGWPDSHHVWDAVLPLLTDRFHVVAYDTCGNGASTRPSDRDRFSVAELAQDFRAVVAAVSPDRPVHVVGHDWGSVQIWEAVCTPGAEQLIATFTSISGPSLDHLGMWARRRLTARSLGGPLRQLLASSYTFLFQLPVLPGLIFPMMTEQRWRRFVHSFDSFPAEQMHLGDTFRSDILSGLPIYRANIVPTLRRPRQRHTSVPVQLVVNLYDKAVRPIVFEDEDLWVQRLRRLEIPAGHWSPCSHPELIAAAVAEFAAAPYADS